MPGCWRIASFEAERAVGVVRERDSGREASFSVEAWVPCDAETAHGLQDSDERRHLLLPQQGEPVDVEWKRGWRGDDVVARVTRATPLERVLPTRTFRAWLAEVGRVVPEVADWTDDEWNPVYAAADVADGDYEATVSSSQPWHAEAHLGLLAWTRANVLHEVVTRRLGWVRLEPNPGCHRVEAWGAPGDVWLALRPDQVDALVRARLVITAE